MTGGQVRKVMLILAGRPVVIVVGKLELMEAAVVLNELRGSSTILVHLLKD